MKKRESARRPPARPSFRNRIRAAARPVRRKPARRDDHDATIDRRIAAGEEPEAFLCIDCFCWSLEPAFCGCWARAVFPAD